MDCSLDVCRFMLAASVFLGKVLVENHGKPMKSQGKNPWNPTFSSSIFWLTFWPLVSLCGFTLYGTNISHLGKGPFMFLGRDSLSSTGQTCHFNKAMFPLWEMFSNWKERYKAMLGVAEGRCWKVVKPFLLLKDSKTFKKSISAVSQILCPPRLLQANKYTK